jgi:hypothetical protein
MSANFSSCPLSAFTDAFDFNPIPDTPVFAWRDKGRGMKVLPPGLFRYPFLPEPFS